MYFISQPAPPQPALLQQPPQQTPQPPPQQSAPPQPAPQQTPQPPPQQPAPPQQAPPKQSGSWNYFGKVWEL